MKLSIKGGKGRRVDVEWEGPDSTTVEDLKQWFYQQTHFYPERQMFRKEANKTAIKEGTLKDNGVQNGDTLLFKDLGLQMSYRLVFVYEYLGPILLALFFFLAQALVYGKRFEHSFTQKVALFMILVHYGKRELESLFVHRFSHATMPITRLPINCAHYWILFGVMVSYFVFHPEFRSPWDDNPVMVIFWALVMTVAEVLNYLSHVTLRNLRPRGTTARQLPIGLGFGVIACVNYTYEMIAWLAFAVMVNTLTMWFFLLVAVAQMGQWALKKKQKYRKEFGDKAKARYAMIPPFL